MSTVLKEENIVLNAEFNNKERAIRFAGEILLKEKYVKPEYIDYMIERDKRISTYIGNHIAIPHGIENFEESIIESGISIVQVPNGVSFGENETAYIIMGIAGKNNTHLDMLSKIAIVCMEEENVEKMRNAQTKKQLLELFNELN